MRRFVICATALLLAVSGLSSPATSDQASSSGPQAPSATAFVDNGRDIRIAAIAQAGGCDAASLPPAQAAECRAFRPAQADHSDDHVVAGFRSHNAAASEARARRSRVVDRIADTKTVRLAVPEGDKAEAFAERLRKDPDVVFAEPDHAVRAFQEQSQVVDWGVRAIRADEAHAANDETGDGVTVAIIDSGIDYTHSDLDANIAINTAEDDGDGVFEPNGAADNDGVDQDNNGFVDDVAGYDFSGRFYTSTEPDNDPIDVLGHGTHVAGIVAAEDNNRGVLGVAPMAEILPVRVLDDGGAGFDSTIAEGIYYAVDNGADIINMSLGGYGRSTAMRLAVEYARANEVAVVAAAGNSWFYSLPSFPAAYPDAISVAAAADDDPASDIESLSKVWFSDWGHTDFLAPGVDVLSTTPDETYARFSGTSMAAPHVAGALALVREAVVEGAGTPTVSLLEQQLGYTANDVYFNGGDEASGAGVPDTFAATNFPGGPETTQLYRDRYLIRSDGDQAATLTYRHLLADGTPVVGEAVTWSTDKGSITPLAPVTDVNGEVRAVLSAAAGTFGAATIQAAAVLVSARTRVMIEDPRLRVDDAEFALEEEFDECFDDPFCEEFTEEEPPDGEEEPGIERAIPQPGDNVVLRTHIGQHDFGFNADEVSELTWEVTDPVGVDVPDLSGELDPVSVFGFGGQSSFESDPMTIPADAPAGRYELEVTATTAGGLGSRTLEKAFFIGTRGAEVLLVNHSPGFDTETFNFFWEHKTDSVVRRALDALGKTYTVWEGGTPPLDVLEAHSVVIHLGGWFDSVDSQTLQEYVDGGGNLIVSGTQFATNARFSSSEHRRYRDLLNATALANSFFPDNNHQQSPVSVEFQDTTIAPFDSLLGTVQLSPYDLNHAGEATAIFTDELKLFAPNGAESIAEYPTGTNAANGFEAGTVLDTPTSRVINLGFGLEAVNGNLTSILDPLLDFFEPTLSITSVAPARVRNDGKGSFTITGEGFQRYGWINRVKLGTIELSNFEVLSHTEIRVNVPRRFKTGRYDVTVTNTDGQTDTLASAIRVVKP